MGQPILEVEHLKKSYVNNVPILDDVSFSLQKGEVVVIVGPSGCGKSTFLRCINRLEEIDTGVLKLNGVSYEKEKKNISKVREKIGMVFQSYDLFPNMTILNNLLLAPMKVQKRNKEEVKKEAEQLLDRVGLLDKKDNYPRQLSGGQKQRVALVRAMLMHPEVLLLDEITAALDPEMVREVLDVVLELAQRHDDGDRHARNAVCPHGRRPRRIHGRGAHRGAGYAGGHLPAPAKRPFAGFSLQGVVI